MKVTGHCHKTTIKDQIRPANSINNSIKDPRTGVYVESQVERDDQKVDSVTTHPHLFSP